MDEDPGSRSHDVSERRRGVSPLVDTQMPGWAVQRRIQDGPRQAELVFSFFI
jgi:hypothetical protein